MHETFRRFIVGLLVVIPLGCSHPVSHPRSGAGISSPAPDPTHWRDGPSLSLARESHTATLLADGRVLIVGGEDLDHHPNASIEIYDPKIDRISPGPALPAPRSNHIAMRLDSGLVLIAGGGPTTPIGQPLGGPNVLSSALLYDPATNTLRETGALPEGHSHFGAVRLPSGRIFIAGGGGSRQDSPKDCGRGIYCGPFAVALADAAIYDPATGSWRKAASMTTGRNSFSLSLTGDGRVIAVGGANAQAEGFTSSELYDPRSDRWQPGPTLVGPPRQLHSSAALGSGRVLVCGGKNPNVAPLKTTELFDGTTFHGGPSYVTTRTLPGLVELESGNVLSVGGYNQLARDENDADLAEALIYSDAADTWATIAPLRQGRVWHSMTRLRDGRVLVCGGKRSSGVLASCELGEP